MQRLHAKLPVWLLAALLVTLCAGCDTGFIAKEARSSLASFVTGVFTTAINATMNP